MSIDIIRRNLTMITQQISDAAVRSGRNPADVKLVAVTKYAEWSWIQNLRELLLQAPDSSLQSAGPLPASEQRERRIVNEPVGSFGSRAIQPSFGENRPQQLAERQQLLPDVEWHLIGQLQRNKVKLALQHASLIHSVDSVRLLERIAVVAQELNQIPRILIQVNLSREESKSGFDAATIRAEWNDVVSFADRVHIEGFMTMAAEADDPETARPVFRELRELRDELRDLPSSKAKRLTLPELSMGMSGDFIPAIEEGATLVRIGSRLFEGL